MMTCDSHQFNTYTCALQSIYYNFCIVKTIINKTSLRDMVMAIAFFKVLETLGHPLYLIKCFLISTSVISCMVYYWKSIASFWCYLVPLSMGSYHCISSSSHWWARYINEQAFHSIQQSVNMCRTYGKFILLLWPLHDTPSQTFYEIWILMSPTSSKSERKSNLDLTGSF